MGSVGGMDPLDNPIDPTTSWVAAHIRQYTESGGAEGHEWRGVPTLLLTTIGARTGQGRRTPLIYGRDGDAYVIVASKGGSDTAPNWYGNLTREPRVRVQVGPDVFDGFTRAFTEKPPPGCLTLSEYGRSV